MSLITTTPFDNDFRNFERSINRIMNDFWRDTVGSRDVTSGGTISARGWVPRMDVHETEKDMVVTMELPGVPKDKVNIDVRDQVLTVSGEHTEDKTYENANRHVTERRYGNFSRSVQLPPHLQTDKATANFENGVLTVRIAKGEAPGSRRITIS
ncbi:uncharacterized protein VTP21DRAFT_6571 [Calcarisporiella thermophila]|uniref:uncharacterized protein n=1 Tax=Calcarisporiella thermophila TaxID=911321 RepID=UPI003743FCF6